MLKKTIFSILVLLLCFTQLVSAQDTLRGKVMDSDSLPFWATRVEIKGTGIETFTEQDGSWQFIVKRKNLSQDTLEFSFLGFDTQYITIGDEREFNVVLELDSIQKYRKEHSDTLRGKVMDSYSQPLIAASVALKETAEGTFTGMGGSWQLITQKENLSNYTLEFSFIGYVTKEVTIGEEREFNVVLEIDSIERNKEHFIKCKCNSKFRRYFRKQWYNFSDKMDEWSEGKLRTFYVVDEDDYPIEKLHVFQITPHIGKVATTDGYGKCSFRAKKNDIMRFEKEGYCI